MASARGDMLDQRQLGRLRIDSVYDDTVMTAVSTVQVQPVLREGDLGTGILFFILVILRQSRYSRYWLECTGSSIVCKRSDG
ncbi:hypothetical protein D3C75_1169890 [compost metagenome]